MSTAAPDPLGRAVQASWRRQARELPADAAGTPEPTTRAEPRATREAAGTLLAQLSPQERAAVVLKDAFGLSLDEVAEALSTTAGAIKTALHRDHEVVAPPRCELRAHRGESLLLWWSGDAVHAVVRAEVDGDRIARLCSYYHAPDVLTEVCRELGVPVHTHGDRPTADQEAS
ncbi:MAG TPA: sigma factor-like helix-turn-helix DNA-binding protein [Kofleriaceae bacterium]|jgi:hypothetical protein|nr:sigma factor-like helix-turn-helix DNA-binding protein [Kofleriaceae bacterium]